MLLFFGNFLYDNYANLYQNICINHIRSKKNKTFWPSVFVSSCALARSASIVSQEYYPKCFYETPKFELDPPDDSCI